MMLLAYNTRTEILVNLKILQLKIQEELKNKEGFRRVLKFIQTVKHGSRRKTEMNKNDKQ